MSQKQTVEICGMDSTHHYKRVAPLLRKLQNSSVFTKTKKSGEIHTYFGHISLGPKINFNTVTLTEEELVHPIAGQEGPKGEQMYSSTLPSTSALKGMGGQRHAPATLFPGKKPGTHCTGGWVGPRVGLDGCGKSRLPPGFDPRTVRPVASRYTD